MSVPQHLYDGGDFEVVDKKVVLTFCKVCGEPAGHSGFCSGLCESEFIVLMEAMSELQEDPSFWIEQYAEEYRPAVAAFFERIGVVT